MNRFSFHDLAAPASFTQPGRLANVVRITPVILGLSMSLSMSACVVGPNYNRPDAPVPIAYKEQEGWKQAQPRDAVLRGAWWEAYGDPLLDGLMAQISVSNQNLAQAEARYRQAQALVLQSRAAYAPSVGANLSTTRSSAGARNGNSINNTGINNNNLQIQNDGAANVTGATTGSSGAINSNALTLGVSWEIDLWGRVQRTVEARNASAQASAGDLEAARLSAQAQLAQTYFALRSLDSQQDLLERTLIDYERSVKLTQNQYDAGIVAKANLILAQTQLKSTQAQALDLGVQRAQFEHAIALLVGKAPAELSIDHGQLMASVPNLPVALPSALLERRPDIAAAERRMAAANAETGVATAAYYPNLSFSASAGARTSVLGKLISLPNRFWSLGPSLAATLFDGGARRAQVAQATAAYDGTVAAYRQVVLTGFQEVEDQLATLRILAQEAVVQDEAMQLARRSVALANNQYKAGVVTYLNVVQIQATALNAERTVIELLNRRLAASVLLIRALGGGWDADAHPAGVGIE